MYLFVSYNINFFLVSKNSLVCVAYITLELHESVSFACCELCTKTDYSLSQWH